jgi:hypothetical protein
VSKPLPGENRPCHFALRSPLARSHMLIDGRASDVKNEIFEIHIRPLEREQLAHTKAGENVQEDGGFCQNPEDALSQSAHNRP